MTSFTESQIYLRAKRKKKKSGTEERAREEGRENVIKCLDKKMK